MNARLVAILVLGSIGLSLSIGSAYVWRRGPGETLSTGQDLSDLGATAAIGLAIAEISKLGRHRDPDDDEEE